MNEKARSLVKGVKDVSDFLGDALDAFKDSNFILETIEKASPWLRLFGEAAVEVIPTGKFFVKLVDEFLKETDPEKLGFTACTIAFQQVAIIAFKSAPGPSGERQAIKIAKERLEEVGNFDEVDIGTINIDTPTNHEFFLKSLLCFEVAAKSAGYVDGQVEDLTLIVQGNFKSSLIKLLSDGKHKDKFKPFKDYLGLGGPGEKNVRKLLAHHAGYQRWLFEEAPVLKISPFALKHVYTDIDCKKTTWGEFNKIHFSSQEKSSFLRDDSSDRLPLLETIIDLIKSRTLSEAIIIQGTAGSGKSSFTLKLYDELLKNKLHPIRVRIRDLGFDPNTHIEDELPKAIKLGDEDYPVPVYSSGDFSLKNIFTERGVGDFSHISKYVLILDGWDEISVSNEGFKKKVAQMLAQLNDTYLKRDNPQVRVILTGRPSSDIGDTQNLRERSPFINLLRFTPMQLTNYISGLRKAVNAKKPLIPKTNLTEDWLVPDEERFAPIIKQYAETFQSPQSTESSKLGILGLPLLTHLTVRLVAEWPGNLSPLIENTTTLYRHLIDLTCQEAGKVDESHDQHKFYGDDLRRLLRGTAHAITLSGGENISRKELLSRLEANDVEFNNKLTELEKENKMSSLLISFYFKGGHAGLGCEFAHKSFREYLFAEAIIEALKDYGRQQSCELSSRPEYWIDFSSDSVSDHRFDLSRRLSMLLAPQWLTAETSHHIRELIKWEIERALKPNEPKRPGLPAKRASLEEWRRIRDGLADLWQWWGEGVHLRPQRRKDTYSGKLETREAYVNNLISWHAPRDERIDNWVPARTTTMDAHLGDGLFLLCAAVHAAMALTDDDEGLKNKGKKEYQSVREINGKPIFSFKPSGGHRDYFKNYANRINSAGWRPGFPFPGISHMKYIDLSICDLYLFSFDMADLEHADFHSSYIANSSFFQSNVAYGNFNNAFLPAADFGGADLRFVNFENSSLNDANLTSADLRDIRTNGGTYFVDANLESAHVSRSVVGSGKLEKTVFTMIFVDGKEMTRAEVLQLETEGDQPES